MTSTRFRFRSFLISLFLLVAGCAGQPVQQQVIREHHHVGTRNRKRLQNRIYTGLHVNELAEVMSHGSIPIQVGTLAWYESSLQQPFRIRNIRRKNQKYTIYYYWTKTKSSDDYLTPVIIQEDRVVARGWENRYVPLETLREESWGP